MGHVRLCLLLFFIAALVSATDLSVRTAVRSDTPWGHLLIEATKAVEDGHYAQGAAAYQSAIRLITSPDRHDRIELAFAYNGLGNIDNKIGQAQDAEPLFKKALAIWTQALGPGNLLIAVVMNNLAESYMAMGKHEEAQRYQTAALKVDQAVLGPAAALVANDWNNLGVTYAHEHKFSDAEKAMRHAIAVAEALPTPHPRLSEFTGNLASLLSVLNHVEEAEQMHGRVLDMQVKERGRTHQSVGLTLVHLADCEIKLKRYATAVRYAAEAAGILRSRLGEHNPRTAAAYFALARAYEKLKRTDLAEPAMEVVIDIDKQTVIDPSDRSAHLREYAIVLRDEGKRDEAKAAEQQASEVEEADAERAARSQTVDVKELGVKY